MTTDTLRAVHNIPLEREFESWIVWGIENYLRSIDRQYSIHAITPGLERSWPADERLTFSGKVVGLQMKKALIGDLKKDQDYVEYDRLKWSFAQPQNQYRLVQQHPEIFYCLPTFINRKYRREAIHHCLFWRPDPVDEKNAWYDNGGARVQTPYDPLNDQSRWGLFYENIIRCDAGARVTSKREINQFLSDVASTMSEFDVSFLRGAPTVSKSRRQTEAEGWGGFYILAVEV